MPTEQKTVKASSRVVDMTNVKDSGGGRFNTRRVPAGDYLARIIKVEDAEVKSGDNKGDFQWLFTVALETHPTNKYPYYCKLAENQLWKIRNLLVAAGINVPKKKMRLDPTKVEGKLIAVTMEDDEFDGKQKSVIAAVFPPSELSDYSEGASTPDDDDDEDDEDAATTAAVDDDEEEEETPVSNSNWSTLANLDRAGLKQFNADEELGVKVLKSMSDDDLRSAVAAAAGITEPADLEEEEDDEEEDAPVVKRGKRKAAVTDDDLEELDIDDV